MVEARNLPEIQVRYILPTVHKELAKALVELGTTAKEAAKLLEITPAAVSQYLNDKRATTFQLSPSLKAKVKDAASDLRQGKHNVLAVTMHLLREHEMMKLACNYHKNQDDSLPHNCDICMR